MGPIIRENKGFIMQYLGDGFMALFPGGSQHALRASVQMHVALEEYNRDRADKGRSPGTNRDWDAKRRSHHGDHRRR